MKKNKTVIAFIILALLLVIFFGITLYTSILSYMEVSSQADLKVSGMIDTLNRVQDQINDLEAEFRIKTENTMELMCTALRPFVHGENYDGPEVFADGVVVQYQKGSLSYPESFSGSFVFHDEETAVDHLPLMAPATLTENPDDTRPVLISAGKIDGSYYYVGWKDVKTYESAINYNKTIGEAISALEKLYGAKMLLFWEPEDGTSMDEIEILYVSGELGTPGSLKDLGISAEDLSSENSKLTIGKKLFSATYEKLMIFDRPAKAIVLLNTISSNTYVLNCIIIAAGFILICMSGFILWLRWIKDYSRDHELTDSQKQSWEISALRKRAISIGLTGALLLFILLLGYQLLGNLSRISASNQESLDIMMARLEDNSKRVYSAKAEEEDWGVYYAGRIADLYSRVPEVRNAEFLQKANELTGSEYIMIFDGKGKEILSSNGYVGFTLGDGVNTDEDFSYLLQGIEKIIHEPEQDKFTGKTLQMMGVRMDLGDPDSYGAVILAFDPKSTWEFEETQDIAKYVRMLSHQENLSLIISRETGEVLYSSDQDLLGKSAAELGLNTEKLQPVSLETFEIGGQKRYGAYNEDDQYFYLFMTDSDSIWGDSLKFSAFSAVWYLITCLVLSHFLLGSFSADLAMIMEQVEKSKGKLKEKPDLSTGQAMLNAFIENNRKDLTRKEQWHDLTPEQKVGKLLKLTITLLLIILLVILLDRDQFGSRSVINFILNGSWKRQLNELSVAAIIFVMVSLIAFILFKDLIVRLVSEMLSPKGKTIVGLVSSLLQYIAIITAIFVSLSYLGFDTGVLITSASILTLAISLGSKDLVADILSGIFIIFEGDFHVGDTIEINGFKGKVMDIGVRSTKLIDGGNNIKIIDNQSVKNVLNLSRKPSLVVVSLTISSTQPLEEIEAMLESELPEIGEQISLLISGPFYFGIDTIGYKRITFNVGAFCRQEDVNKVKPLLNHHLYDAFRNYGIKI